jgi:hypothetical protein
VALCRGARMFIVFRAVVVLVTVLNTRTLPVNVSA